MRTMLVLLMGFALLCGAANSQAPPPPPNPAALFCDEGLGPNAGDTYLPGYTTSNPVVYFPWEDFAPDGMFPDLDAVSGTLFTITSAFTLVSSLPNMVVSRPLPYNNVQNNVLRLHLVDGVSEWSFDDTSLSGLGPIGKNFGQFSIKYRTVEFFLELGVGSAFKIIFTQSLPGTFELRIEDTFVTLSYVGLSFPCMLPSPLVGVQHIEILIQTKRDFGANLFVDLLRVRVGTEETICSSNPTSIGQIQGYSFMSEGTGPGSGVFIDEYHVRDFDSTFPAFDPVHSLCLSAPSSPPPPSPPPNPPPPSNRRDQPEYCAD